MMPKMQWGESVRLAWWALSHDKLKAFLTMLGIMIGSTALVLVVTIASVGKSYVVAQIEGIGANLAYASLDRNGRVPDDELSRQDLTAAKYLPGVTAVAGTYDLPARFVAAGKLVHARLVGVTEDFQKIRNLHVTGRYFDPEDFSSRDRVCLVTDRVAKTAFGQNAAIGNTMRLDQFRCTIIGTFKEAVSTFGRSEIQDQTVLVAFPLIRVMNGDDYFQVIYVQAASSADVPRVTQDLKTILRRNHRKEARYSVDNLSSLLSTARDISIAMTAVLVAVALVTLTAAGIGIMNIMLFNVSQRTREIGIRMAIGARQADIRLQFLFEAVFISLSGAVVGIALALGLIGSVASAGLAPIGISWAAVILTLLVSTGTGILFGYRPADEAAKLSPIDALRDE
jgi:putative ABC transport system permease protein